MSFIWTWIWERLSGVIQITTKPEIVGRAEVDNQVGEKVVRDGGKVSAKKSNRSPKSTGVRSNNTSKTSRKSTGKAVRTTAIKSKVKSKTISKD
jgi:hypothetical protein